MNFAGWKVYAPIVTRLGVAAVFLWFGVSQLIHAQQFVDYLPGFLYESSYATTFVIANGVFEIVFGALLALGYLTRIASLVLAAHLMVIAIEVGYGEVAVRDFGLSLATLAVFLHGPDNWCLSERKSNKSNS